MGWKSNKFRKFTISFLAIISLSGFLEGEQLDEIIDGKKDSFQKIAIDIWELAELGYLENQSSKLLADELSKNGFKITKGVAGIPTSFIAEYSNGGPVVGILGEFDALPGLAQTTSPFKEVAENKTGAGHACGHHLFLSLIHI